MQPYYEHAGITIYHGDCREIMPHLGKVDAVVTDPPYGVKAPTVSASGSKWRGKKEYTPIIGDHSTELFEAVWDDITYHFPDVLSVVFGGNYFTSFLPPSRCWYIWDKERTGNYADVEIAWCSKDGNAKLFKHMWNGLCRETEIGQHYHPTQKPVAVMKWILQLHDTAQTILDPFMGSGTTLVAAKQLGRKAIGIELEEKYCEIAAKRLAQEVLQFPEAA